MMGGKEKIKAFYGNGEQIETQINKFLSQDGIFYKDLKYIHSKSVSGDFAILIYSENKNCIEAQL